METGAKGVHRNFLALLIDAAGFPLGFSFISIQVIIPNFLDRLGAGNILIGLVPALANFGANFPSLFTAAWVERHPYVRRLLFFGAIAERIPYLVLAFCTWLLGREYPSILLLIFFVSWGANNFIMGFNLPAYFTMVAKASLPNQRGFIFGLGSAIGGLLGAAGAVLSRAILLKQGFPVGYAICFAIGFTILTLSVLPFAFMKEPRHEPAPDAPGLWEHLHSLPRVLRTDPGFGRFILAQCGVILAIASSGFYAVFAERNLGAGTGQLGVYNAVLMGTTGIAGLVLGFLADRRGHRAVMDVTALASALASLAAVFSLALPNLMLLVFSLTALANIGLRVSSSNIVLEFSGSARAATYTALAMVLPVPLRFGAPLLAGLAADHFGYWPVFLASAIFGMAAVVLFHFVVPEPRRRARTTNLDRDRASA